MSRNIIAKPRLWVKFPSSNEDIREAKQQWQEKYSFPGAIGAIDCTHVLISKPSRHGDEYVNRKGFTNLNVQATCDALDRFTSVDVQWPGTIHDNRIWKNSSICPIMRHNTQNALLLGDEGYGLEPCLVTPYRNPRTPQQIAYNNLLRRERVSKDLYRSLVLLLTIERCFANRCLSNDLRYYNIKPA